MLCVMSSHIVVGCMQLGSLPFCCWMCIEQLSRLIARDYTERVTLRHFPFSGKKLGGGEEGGRRNGERGKRRGAREVQRRKRKRVEGGRGEEQEEKGGGGGEGGGGEGGGGGGGGGRGGGGGTSLLGRGTSYEHMTVGHNDKAEFLCKTIRHTHVSQSGSGCVL